MNDRKFSTPQELIDHIIAECRGLTCIYRGTNQVHEQISSAIWRNHQGLFKSPSSAIRPIDIEKNLVAKLKGLYGAGVSEIEVLTEWRHFGGETNFIDFSANVLVALFFACHGKYGEDGQVIARPTANLQRVEGFDYGDLPPETCIVRPARTQLSAPRTLTQNSVFLHVPGGVISKESCFVVDVPSELKLPCLAYLKKHFGIDEYTIYNDLFGYLGNEGDLIKVEQLFHEGLELASAGRLGHAIDKFDQAIKLDPRQAEIHYNRGQVHQRLQDFEKAREDYGRAIALNPEDAKYHFSSGIVISELGDLDQALHNLNVSIELDPGVADYYNFRGLLKMRLENHTAAIADYDLAIALKHNEATFHYNRGTAKKSVGDLEGAKMDFEQAGKLDPDKYTGVSPNGNK